MASDQYLVYYIHLTDAAQVKTLQGTPFTGSAVGAILEAPSVAAVTYSAPILAAGAEFVAPCITSDWFKTQPSFPTDQKQFDRKNKGLFGWLGIPLPWPFGGSTIHFHWRGQFVYDAPLTAPTGTVGNPGPFYIKPRRWIDGFEFPTLGEGGSGAANETYCSRDASRHVGGYGLAIRPGATDVRGHTPDENIGGALPDKSWERFYIRPRSFPLTAPTMFWRCNEGLVSPSLGIVLALTPTGQIAVFMSDAAAVLTLVGTTSALTLHRWVRLDLAIAFGIAPVPPAGVKNIKLAVNGSVVFEYSDLTHGMSIAGRKHGSSTIGCPAAHTLALDVDDWMCANYSDPVDSIDYQNGSAIVLLQPTALDPSTANFAGDWRTLLQNPTKGSGETLASVTAGALLRVATDAEEMVDELPEGLGPVAMLAAFFATAVGPTAGSKLALESAALVGAVETSLAFTAVGWYRNFWTVPASTQLPPKPVGPLKLRYTHGAAGAINVSTFLAEAEILGNFGPEDITHPASPAVLPPHMGAHNAPYPRSIWARLTKPPLQPVFVRASTYVGNGAGLDLTFSVPIHFLWIRPVTGDTGGVKWWSSLLASHNQQTDAPHANLMVAAMADPDFVPGDGPTGNDLPATPATELDARNLANDIAYGYTKHLAGYWDQPGHNYLDDPPYFFKRMLGWLAAGGVDEAPFGLYAVPPSSWNKRQEQYVLRLAGDDTQNNAVGVVYSYLAIGDPGMRFMLNGALTNPKGTADQVTDLIHPRFTPQAGFFLPEIISGGGSTVRLAYKGPGHAAASLSPLDVAQVANAVTFGLATVGSKSAYHLAAASQIPFSLWRTDDTSGHAGAVVQLLSYPGDGTGARVIPLTPASGKRPLWALVVPHDGPAFMRDPSHTGTTSTALPSTINAATGITDGGIDSITVGALLNVAGILYDVFVIPGSTTACVGGWSCGGDFEPVPPEPPPDAPTPPEPPTTPPFPPVPPAPPTAPPSDPLPPVGPMPDLTDDLAPACRPATERIVNLAVSRLGSDLVIANLATDQTKEATLAREVYTDAVQATLRDFPWPFATRYVRLQIVSDPTIAVNSDWIYSYRQPSDCLFERRIVVVRQGAVDPTPPPFQLSSDDVGGLLFTNQPNAVLEYTCRPKCPHTRSEPLFRDAVAWKLAHAMAPALTRIEGKSIECQKMYDAAIAQAQLILRPGNPGELTQAPTVDVAVAAQAANVYAVNRGLVKIGARMIRNLTTDQSREAQDVKVIFEDELRSCLRDFPWPFASVYATLTLVGGTATVRLNNDWHYSYRVPVDCLFARRLVTAFGRAPTDRHPPPFKLGQDATGALLYTDVADAELEYTTRPEGAVLIADPLFRDAFSWRLAAVLAPALAQTDPEKAEQLGRGPQDPLEPKKRPETGIQLRARVAGYAWAKYAEALRKAAVAAANEQQRDLNPPDADWIRSRE